MKSSLRACSAVLLSVVCLATPGQGAPAPESTILAGTKVAVIVIQDTTSDRSERVLTAIGYARQFKRAGADVHLLFDGDGIEWLDLAYDDKPAPKRKAAKAPVPYGEQKKTAATVEPSGKVIPLPAPETPAEQAVVRQPEPSIIARVRKNLDGLSQAGIPVRASARAADRKKLRAKLRGKPFAFVNEPDQPDLVPELMAQGYKILIF